ncbi:MAG: type II toxin-antitoxin system PemK/MazF family toxin [candidate division NC10 bacterium]|nr:type II toxin-antitoxin system PemK/MazF family toxin [candidate division NC10 bacterium]
MTSEAMHWRVYLAHLDPVRGSEQRGTRPVVVVSHEAFNRLMPVVTILPLTSLKPGRRVYSNEARLPRVSCGLRKESLVLAHQIRTIDKGRLVKAVGVIADQTLRASIEAAMRVHLGLAGSHSLTSD